MQEVEDVSDWEHLSESQGGLKPPSKIYLVTGGAGSLGREIVDILIKQGYKVRAMDNCESNLAALNYPEFQFTRIYGDIRDYTRVHYAMRGCDTVIHTAAMKNLDITEGDVPELNRTNITGSENVAKAAIECGVDCAILISTDKAVYPASAYGASKLLAEWIWKWAAKTQTHTRFVTFRSGNFKQSSGNVLEVWDRQQNAGEPLTITDLDMERYFIDTKKAAEIVCMLPNRAVNGDVVIPKMQLQKILDLMFETHPNCTYRTTGVRSGEKRAERLMSDDEQVTYESEDFVVIS
jgi:UDP-N-acetylglucosamine 4,6-dehydratase